MTFLILHGIGGYAGIHWEGWLSRKLASSGHTVLMPNLPNPSHPDREAWLEAAKHSLSEVDHDKLVIIAHSLGVTTALDYIEQNPVLGLVSVSGFANDYNAELNSYFLREKTIDFALVRPNIKTAIVFYGDNDPYVPQDSLAELAAGLGAHPHVVHSGGHLNSDAGYSEFPELLTAIIASFQ